MLVLFAALIGPYFVDWSSYRADFEREASRILGQKVKVLGTAEARLLPFPSVTFGNVVVGENEDGQPMMNVERFSMDAELAPFLSGEIRIFDMRIESPRATVRLSETGELDWALRSEKSLPSQSVILESITVSNGYATIIDDQNGRRHVAEDLNLTMSAKTIRGPWHVEGSGRFDGYGGAISLSTGLPLDDGSLRLRTQIRPDGLPVSIELEGNAGITDLKPKYAGSFAAQTLDPQKAATTNGSKGSRARQPFEARVQGQFELDNERLRIPEYRLQSGPRSNPYIISGEATFDTGAEPEFLLTADGQQVNFNRMEEDGQSLADFASSRSFQQRLADFRRLVNLVPVPNMPGKVSMAIPAIVAGDTTFREILLEASPQGNTWKLDRLEAKLPGRTTFLAGGTLGVGNEFGFTGDMLIASKQPSGFASWLTDSVDPSIRRLDAAGLSAKVDLSPQLQRFEDLEIIVGKAILNGRLERVVPRQARPSLSLDIDGRDVDSDALRALAALFSGKGHENRLGGHDVDADMHFASLQIAGVSADQVDVSVRLKGGTLDIDRLTVNNLAGASLAMTGKVDNAFEAPEGYIKPTIRADDMAGLSTVLAELTGNNPFAEHIRRRADLFENTTIDINARFETPDGGKTRLKAEVSGNTGGTQIDVVVDGSDALAAFGAGPMTASVTARNFSSRKLLAQLGVDVTALVADSAASISLQTDKAGDSRTNFDLSYTARDIDIEAGGLFWYDEEDRLLADFGFGVKTEDLSPYLLSYGYGYDSSLLSLPVDLSSLVSLSPDALEASELDGTVNGIRVSGDLSAPRGSEALAVRGALRLSDLDLGYVAEMLLGQQVFTSADGRWNTTAFTSSLPDDLVLDIALAADKANIPFGGELAEFSGTMVLEGTELQLRNAKATWEQGVVEGTLNLSNLDGSGILSGQLAVSNVALSGQMWPAEDGLPVAEGTLDLSVSVEGSGKTMDELVSSLTGSGILTAHDLDIRGLASDALAPMLQAADRDDFEADAESVGALARSIVPTGSFHSDDATAPFTLAAGVMRMSNVMFTDSEAVMTGDARIDLPAGAVEARFRVEYDPGLDALTGAAPAFELNFSGSFASPDRGWNVSELTNFLSLRAYERERRRVEMLQAVVLEKQRLRRELALARDYLLRQQRLREIELQRQTERQAAEEEKRRQEQERLLEEMRRQEEERAAQRAADRAAAEAERVARDNSVATPSNVPVPRQPPTGAEPSAGGIPLFSDDFYRKLDEAINPRQPDR